MFGVSRIKKDTILTLESIDRRNETVSFNHSGYLDSHQYLLLVG